MPIGDVERFSSLEILHGFKAGITQAGTSVYSLNIMYVYFIPFEHQKCKERFIVMKVRKFEFFSVHLNISGLSPHIFSHALILWFWSFPIQSYCLKLNFM